MGFIAIVGSGALGGALAHALATRDRVAEVRLIDPAGQIARGKALDIQQAGAIDGFHTRLIGTDDLSRVAGCNVCIVADRYGAPSAEWSGEDGLTMLERLRPYVADAPLVFAGPLQAGLIATATREQGISRERLVGSAPEALAGAITAIVAMEARCSPREIALTVLGMPPDRVVIPWGEASIGGPNGMAFLPSSTLPVT